MSGEVVHTFEEHIERKVGELFLTNSEPNYYFMIGWKSKRMGDVAFDIHGKPVPGLFPVFVSIKELRDAGHEIEYPV